ncbi:uncharacterized protein [Typha angustifolia]|uniref:uncharacterized protein isoform X2 n=1 Tax=Typha angustifolia TaxID=59011 RepID=UPI003C30C921
MAAASSSSYSTQYRSRFGDTTLTKVFVGGLAWETPSDELRQYFEQFGEILEAVVITDKNTGRSKGYGFVTFKDPDSARRSVEDPNPVIDGRKANCNIASMGRPRPTPPSRGRNQNEGLHHGPPLATGPQYSRVREQMPSPAAVVYHPQFGFVTYPTDYAYQQAFYNAQVTPQYYHQMYGPTSPSTLGSPPYYYTNMGYMPNPRASFLSPPQGPRPLYIQYPAAQMERPFTPSLPDNFQLQPPPNARPPISTMVSSSQDGQRSI